MITKRKVSKLVVNKKIRKKRVGSPRKLGIKKRIIVRKKGRASRRRLRPISGRRRILARRRRVHRRIIQSPRARRAQLAYDQAFNEAYNAGYGVGFAQGYSLELTNPTIA